MQNIGMEFGIEKCPTLTMKSRKRETTEEIEMPNRKRIKMFGEKENYKHFGILKADTIKQADMKENNM